jgi:tRNA dimethylallyltransferase
MTGRTYTSFRKKEAEREPDGDASGTVAGSNSRPFRVVKIGLTLPREEIYDRINRRADKMMEKGLLDEARRLLPMRNLNSLNTVGYKEMFAYFDGKWTLQEAVERMKGNTRRYARKQLTWFKRDKQMTWFSPEDKQMIIRHITSCG